MTIAYINEVSWIGGAERALVDLVAHLDRSRFEPVVVLPAPGELLDVLEGAGVATQIAPFYGFRGRNPLRYFETLFRLWRVARMYKVRLIHVNQQYFVNYGVWLGRMCRTPVVVHLRGVETDSFFDRYAVWLLRADAVICISKATQRKFLNYIAERRPEDLKRAQSKLELIYDGLSVHNAVAHPAALREELQLPADKRIVGIVGQVVAEKGLIEFVDAAKRVLSHRPDVHFVIVGEDPSDSKEFAGRLSKHIDELGIGNSITRTGFRRDAAGLFAVMDVSVLASWQEAFGRVVIESMNAGTPVVATSVGGVPEIVEDGVSGFLVKPQDCESLARGILRALELPPVKRQQLVENGKRSAQRFGILTHVEQVQRVYDRLLDRNGKRG